jgi:hypothetical protein
MAPRLRGDDGFEYSNSIRRLLASDEISTAKAGTCTTDD